MGTKRRWGEVSDVFRAALGRTVDVSKSMAIAYVDFLKRLAFWSLVLVVGLVPLPVIGSIFHIAWLNGLYVVVIALLTCAWITAASPVVMLAQYGYDEIKGVKKLTQLKTGFLFWALLLAIYFYLVPVWNYPKAIPLIFLICFVLALGFVRFGIGINPKLGVGAVIVIFFVITLSFYMPASRGAATAFVGWLDQGIAGRLKDPLQPTPKTPKPLPCDHASIATMTFFSPVTGEPRVWYCIGENGRIELFDGPGYHPQRRQQLQAVDPNVVEQVKNQAEADQAAQRSDPRPRTPQRIQCNSASIERMILFDPITSEPKVWYYRGEDGRIELFDMPGYHPQYKQELQPIVPDVVAALKRQLVIDALHDVSAEIHRIQTDANRAHAPAEGKEQQVVLLPEDTEGQIRERKPPDLVKGRDEFIKPAQASGDDSNHNNR